MNIGASNNNFFFSYFRQIILCSFFLIGPFPYYHPWLHIKSKS